MDVALLHSRSLELLPSAVYIHYPLCKHTCSYCDFNVYTSAKLKNEIGGFDRRWIQGLERDIRDSFANTTEKAQIKTLYLGGGTPSLIALSDLEELLNVLRRYYDFKNLEEFTLEANPETLSLDYLTALKSLGINRLSLGVQSFQTQQLRRLERLSTHQQIFKSLEMVAGIFENFSLDLMIGTPDQNLEGLKLDLFEALKFSPPHISAYILTVKDDHIFRKHSLMRPALENDELVSKLYLHLVETLEKNNYEHYEISNFSKKGFRSKHNSTYWNPENSYLGIGPGAHGYVASEKIRYERNRDPQAWLNQSDFGFVEHLNEGQSHLEKFYLELRTRRPIPTSRFKANVVRDLENSGLICVQNEALTLSDSGWLMMEAIAEKLV